MRKKKWNRILLAVLVLWLVIAWADYHRVSRFELPVFSVLVNGADDGGSGAYMGLGYSFDIQGNFMPEEELPGVTRYTYKILGLEVQSGIRD